MAVLLPDPGSAPSRETATPRRTWNLGHWDCLAALDRVLKRGGLSLPCPGHCPPLALRGLQQDPEPASVWPGASPPACTLPATSGGDPKLLPASPATNASLGHMRAEELWPRPDAAGSEDGRHREASPPCTQDKIDAKKIKAEEIQELWYVAGDLIQLGYLSRGELMRNEITKAIP